MKKVIVFIFVIFFTGMSSSHAQQPVTKMQSLYIYDFIKNIKWNNVEDKYLVGVFADESTVAAINDVIGIRKFNNKTIEVTKVSTATEAGKCQIVFVSSPFKSTLKQLNTPSVLKNTLLVSEEGGINDGASIAFILENSKLKFKINESVCTASGLQVSATLLSLSQ
ncbi:MAG: YfiR family protein [Cyclobacteriaceae bacterium]|nr:YfiR family protein [Cyclobacteriaceae bacterium]